MFARNRAIFLLCSDGINVLDEILNVCQWTYKLLMRRGLFPRSKMAPKKRKVDDSGNEAKDTTPESTEIREKYFTWTDEETALLLKVAISYKTEKTTEGKDWESVKTRYEDLLKLYIERYPKSNESEPEHFPNKKNTDVFDKEKIIAKLKRIKFGYRKAVDSGRRSGGGRVVTLFFDECSELWSGCPAVEAMGNGIETSEEISVSEDTASLPSIVDDSASDDENNDAHSISSVKEAVEKTTDSRRNLISKLKEKKNSKLTKKVTTENRMIALEQEELQLKKRMIDHLEKSEKKYTESMQSFATSLNSLSSTLQNGFNMLGMMMQQNHNQQYNIHPQYQQRYHQQPNDVADVWHLQDSSNYHNC